MAGPSRLPHMLPTVAVPDRPYSGRHRALGHRVEMSYQVRVGTHTQPRAHRQMYTAAPQREQPPTHAHNPSSPGHSP